MELNTVKIEILGTPFNGIVSPPNIENTADGLRQLNLVSLLESKGCSVINSGDLIGFQSQELKDPDTGILDFDIWINLSKCLSESLGEILDRENFPLLLGGDCRMLIGIISAFVQRNEEICLVFLDGHADFHNVETSPTGDPADMELAVLTGRGPEKITRIADKYPLLEEKNILVYGIRAWDQIAESNIQVYDYKKIKKKGIRSVLDQGIENLPNKKPPVWLHLDVDVLDPKIMPVMFPEPGGLSFEQLHEFLRHEWITNQAIGMSIACYHPTLDKEGKAGKKLVSLIADFLSIVI
ncbi:MAG: arginase family protein [Asgard group archaeon]|nr:arginase family protein [Asgard group archaeon]